jgi:hypothetical protein
MIDKLLDNSLEEIKRGISCGQDGGKYTCLICGKVFEKGEMFEHGGRFYEAAKAAQLHVEKEHGSMLALLTDNDKKYTGLTENQVELLNMFSSGLSDKELAQKTGVVQSTIRHQRFIFREKAKQAKLYLAIYETVFKQPDEKKTRKEEELIMVHKGATMIDDRYFITEAEQEKIAKTVFSSLEPLKLRIFSAKEKKKVIILNRIAAKFETGRVYTESEINAILSDIYEDYVTLRRYLIEYGYLRRTRDCKEYWKV